MKPPLFDRDDRAPLALIVLLPLLVAAPLLLGWLQADPMLYRGELALLERGPLRGVPYTDPNNGYTTQALGYRAALDWLAGSVPWWNPYSGVGLPLAAEYQPAAFFPLVFMLLLPKGTVLLQVALQAIAGVGAYGLLKQLGLARIAAVTGGLLFAFNGTLAWFAHGPATAVPFVPWMLWGVERIHASTRAGGAPQWKTFACAMAMGLLAGFPETAYLGGLLALAWAVLRGVQLDRALVPRYAAHVALGGCVGIAIAAPQVVSFLLFLPESDLGGHVGDFARAALPVISLLPSLVAPYAYGPIGAYLPSEAFHHVWGTIGGYVTLLLVFCALYGAVVRRRDVLAWLLGAWIVLALGKTWAVEPALTLMNLIPAVAEAAFMRYAQPTWELALVILAAFGLDALVRDEADRRAAAIAAVLAAALFAGAVSHVPSMWPELNRANGLRNAAIASIAWALLSVLGAMLVLLCLRPPRRAGALAVLLAVEATLFYAIPTLSNPRRAEVDAGAIEFLRAHLGLQRFFTLGPIQPNFGAYFGLASANHNYLPVSRRWIEWIRTRIDPGHADVAVLDGKRPGTAQRLLANPQPWRDLGVTHVIAPLRTDPFAHLAHDSPLRRVFAGKTLVIYELAGARPYFDVVRGRCRVAARGRLRAVADCAEPATLVRRELNMPGWRITVNGAKAPMLGYDDLFQAVELPRGKSDVAFAYAPPRIGWAWGAAAVGLLLLAWPRRRLARAAELALDQRAAGERAA